MTYCTELKNGSYNSLYMGKTGQIRFFEKIEIAMHKLCIVTICGVLFIKYEVCFRFRYLDKLQNLFY